jgi:hypothetical protein
MLTDVVGTAFSPVPGVPPPMAPHQGALANQKAEFYLSGDSSDWTKRKEDSGEELVNPLLFSIFKFLTVLSGGLCPLSLRRRFSNTFSHPELFHSPIWRHRLPAQFEKQKVSSSPPSWLKTHATRTKELKTIFFVFWLPPLNKVQGAR